MTFCYHHYRLRVYFVGVWVRTLPPLEFSSGTWNSGRCPGKDSGHKDALSNLLTALQRWLNRYHLSTGRNVRCCRITIVNVSILQYLSFHLLVLSWHNLEILQRFLWLRVLKALGFESRFSKCHAQTKSNVQKMCKTWSMTKRSSSSNRQVNTLNVGGEWKVSGGW